MLRERPYILHKFNNVPFRYVLWGSWFSSKENFDFVHRQLNKYFIGALKNNRLVALSEDDKLNGRYHKISGLDLQKTKQVFIIKDDSTGELYLVINDFDLDAKAISTTYETRRGVEVFHKSLKQNVGLEKSPTKYEISQSNHIFAAMIAWTKLEVLSIKEQSNHFALKTKLYVKALRSAFDELQYLKQYQTKIKSADQQLISLLE